MFGLTTNDINVSVFDKGGGRYHYKDYLSLGDYLLNVNHHEITWNYINSLITNDVKILLFEHILIAIHILSRFHHQQLFLSAITNQLFSFD